MNILKKLDELLMASVMAEAGSRKMALDYLTPKEYDLTKQKEDLNDFLNNVGLNKVRVYYGVANC